VKDVSRGWHRSASVGLLTKFALGFFALCLATPVCLGAFQFPNGKDLAQEWTITDKSPAGAGPVYARIDDFHQ
jgi:hypothetical protein